MYWIDVLLWWWIFCLGLLVILGDFLSVGVFLCLGVGIVFVLVNVLLVGNDF